MNKRFFIFVFAMTTSLFVFNQWIAPQKEIQTEEQVTEKKVNERVLENRASLNDLPLIHVYEDSAGQIPLTWAIITDHDTYLTQDLDPNLTELFVKNSEGIFEKITLVIKGSKETDFSLYSSSKSPSISSYITEDNNFQLVNFEGEKINVVPGCYENNQLFFPHHIPANNAIALCKSGDKYLPVGIYKSENKTFIPFSKLAEYNTLTTYQEGQNSYASKEEFFVLQNDFMQVVFSNIGGSIAEVNLPFTSKEFPKSVVLPIEHDRIIAASYPKYNNFPNHPYSIVEAGSNEKVLKEPTQGNFHPLFRRMAESKLPEHYAFNTISDDEPSLSNVRYTLTKFDKNSITLEAKLPSRRIIKTYSFERKGLSAPYCLSATIKVEGDSRGLWITSGIPEVELISGGPAPIIKYSTTQNQKNVVEKISMPKISTAMNAFRPDWVSNSNGYFVSIMDPLTEIGSGFQASLVPGKTLPSRITVIDAQNALYPQSKYPGYEVRLPLRKSSLPSEFRLYLGPIDHSTLKKVDQIYSDPSTGYNPNYSETQSFHGWFAFISEPFAKILFMIMNVFHSFTHSWGFSIILLTLVLRIIMYPLNAWSIKSTLKMQEVGPKIKALQNKYKNDPKRSQMEMMKFYKENKVNPFGGCLPLLIQMPFLFGMFDLLKSTFALRGASFIPGWIDNLTAPDVLFSWGVSLPFIGSDFHFLPILLGVVMFFQQKFSQAQNKTNEPLSDQQQQQQKMGTIMTVVFTFLFYKFPSGLNIYWLSSMLLQMLQQWYTMKRKKALKQEDEVTVIPKKKN